MKITLDNQTFSIRWRKASATFVIYQGPRVWESGFSSEEQAADYLHERLSKEKDAEKILSII